MTISSSLSVVLACLVLSAQEAPRPAGARLAERFKQLDRNGDGKITRDEVPNVPMFDPWDLNKAGAVMLEELQTFYTRLRARLGDLVRKRLHIARKPPRNAPCPPSPPPSTDSSRYG